MPTLTVTSGPAAGQSLEVFDEVVVGRGNVELEIDDQQLSRRHVSIRPVEGGLLIEDLDSRNGTWVNGKRISDPVLLSSPGSVRVGQSEIRVEPMQAGATVLREAPDGLQSLGDPERTRQRPLPAAPPAPAAAAPEPPAAPPAPAGAAPEPPAPRRSLRARLPLLAALVVVALLIGVLVYSQTRSSSKERQLRATLTLGVVNQQGTVALFAGVQGGAPSGTGAATVDEVFQSVLANQAKPTTPVSGKLISRFDKGSITSTLTLTATLQADNSIRYTGRGKVTGSSGEFEGAKGSFRYTARQARGSNSLSATLRGTLTY